jgi:hypothetical protein
MQVKSETKSLSTVEQIEGIGLRAIWKYYDAPRLSCDRSSATLCSCKILMSNFDGRGRYTWRSSYASGEGPMSMV